jgi:Ca2+-binding EF-hand superfamily protein
MKSMQWLYWALMCAAATTPAFGAGAARLGATATMELSDKNKDGRIDREEFHQRTIEVFFFADADKDGYLTVGEIEAVVSIAPEAFKRADRDGNGKLSLYEFTYAMHRDFDAADRNADGVIDMAELRVLVGK